MQTASAVLRIVADRASQINSRGRQPPGATHTGCGGTGTRGKGKSRSLTAIRKNCGWVRDDDRDACQHVRETAVPWARGPSRRQGVRGHFAQHDDASRAGLKPGGYARRNAARHGCGRTRQFRTRRRTLEGALEVPGAVPIAVLRRWGTPHNYMDCKVLRLLQKQGKLMAFSFVGIQARSLVSGRE